MGIQSYLRNQGVRFEVLLHQPQASASRRAGSVHVPGDRVAKAVLVHAGDEYVLAVLPSTCRISFRRLAELLRTNEMRLASEEEVALVFADCERGAVPPFGGLYGVRTVVDACLAGGREIIVEANLRHLDLRIRFEDFERIEAPIRGRFADPVANRRRRRAG
jgi:Ala-tRNA(Pro) deacylase